MKTAALFLGLGLLLATASATDLTRPVGSGVASKTPYNVLFILIDDHGAGLQSVLNRKAPVQTPNLERLAARGTWFTQAYADAPACCPSRTALLTGAHATNSGVYYNGQAYRRTSTWISKAQTLPATFKQAGYLTAGYGKIAHNRYLKDDAPDYTAGYYKMFNNALDVTHTQAELAKHIIPGSFQKMWSDSWSWGVLPDEWDRDDPRKLQQDTEFANHTIALLQDKKAQPFFVVCGFWRPHVSWTVPQRYFDRFPVDSIQIPEGFRGDDMEDLPPRARELAMRRGEHEFIVREGLWKKSLQAYYATISYVDEQIGRVLDALESGPNCDNTIVVLAADNGWHVGEKNHWSKFYLSELATKVVFSISVPGQKRQVSADPVSLIDIYPTLVSLCGLKAPATHSLDGADLSPVLLGGRIDRSGPVLSTYGLGSHSLRDGRFRYTHYQEGGEELYDHLHDPHEWTNLAENPAFAEEKKRLAEFLPKRNEPEVEFVEGQTREEDGGPSAGKIISPIAGTAPRSE